MGKAEKEPELFLHVAWGSGTRPSLEWEDACSPRTEGARLQASVLLEHCRKADAAVDRGRFEVAVEHFDAALAAFDSLEAPSAEDRFMECCAAWGKGLSLWNVAVGEEGFAKVDLALRQEAWACLEAVMGAEAAGVAKPLSFVLSWLEVATTVATRSDQWPQVVAMGKFLADLGSALCERPAARAQVIALFEDVLAAAWHVLLDVQPEPARAVQVARGLQACCEGDGFVLLPLREFLFAALMAHGDFAHARHVADEVVQWLVDRPGGDDRTSRAWQERSIASGAAAGDPYDRAQLGNEPADSEPVDRVVGLRGRTALMGAVRGNHLDLAGRLLHRGAAVDFRDPGGLTPLFLAAFGGHPKMIRLLVGRGADVNARTREGDTCLHLSVDRAKTVRLLLELGADPTIENLRGETALVVAHREGEEKSAGLLARSMGKQPPRDRETRGLEQAIAGSVRPTAPGIPSLQYVRRPWYDGNREADVRLICGSRPRPVVEVEDMETLAEVSRQADLVRFETILLQWRPTREIGGRVGWFWFDREAAIALGAAIKGGIVRRLFLAVTKFQPGSLLALAHAVGPGQLRTLGLLWYFSGDDITDEPALVDELGDVCLGLGLQHLTILTGAYDAPTDQRLAAQVERAVGLESCGIHLKDETQLYPLIPAPRAMAAMSRGVVPPGEAPSP